MNQHWIDNDIPYHRFEDRDLACGMFLRLVFIPLYLAIGGGYF